MARNTVTRSLHDAGLAAWFGGTLANAVALNPAAAQASDSASTGAVTNEGWDRWTPVNAVAIGAHLIGSLGQISGNAARIKAQRGVGTMVVAKTLLTGAALGATAYSRALGKKVSEYGAVPAESGTEPNGATPEPAAQALQQLRTLQWVVPALTGALVVVSSFAGEQQRYSEVKQGTLTRLVPRLSKAA
jgi:hypothetical protein